MAVPPHSVVFARKDPARSVESKTSLPSEYDGAAALAMATSAPTLVAPGTALLFVLFPATVDVPVSVVDARETGTVLFGLIATTKALSVATAAVDAGLTAAKPLVPSVIDWKNGLLAVFAAVVGLTSKIAEPPGTTVAFKLAAVP